MGLVWFLVYGFILVNADSSSPKTKDYPALVQDALDEKGFAEDGGMVYAIPSLAPWYVTNPLADCVSSVGAIKPAFCLHTRLGGRPPLRTVFRRDGPTDVPTSEECARAEGELAFDLCDAKVKSVSNGTGNGTRVNGTVESKGFPIEHYLGFKIIETPTMVFNGYKIPNFGWLIHRSFVFGLSACARSPGGKNRLLPVLFFLALVLPAFAPCGDKSTVFFTFLSGVFAYGSGVQTTHTMTVTMMPALIATAFFGFSYFQIAGAGYFSFAILVAFYIGVSYHVYLHGTKFNVPIVLTAFWIGKDLITMAGALLGDTYGGLFMLIMGALLGIMFEPFSWGFITMARNSHMLSNQTLVLMEKLNYVVSAHQARLIFALYMLFFIVMKLLFFIVSSRVKARGSFSERLHSCLINAIPDIYQSLQTVVINIHNGYFTTAMGNFVKTAIAVVCLASSPELAILSMCACANASLKQVFAEENELASAHRGGRIPFGLHTKLSQSVVRIVSISDNGQRCEASGTIIGAEKVLTVSHALPKGYSHEIHHAGRRYQVDDCHILDGSEKDPAVIITVKGLNFQGIQLPNLQDWSKVRSLIMVTREGDIHTTGTFSVNRESPSDMHHMLETFPGDSGGIIIAASPMKGQTDTAYHVCAVHAAGYGTRNQYGPGRAALLHPSKAGFEVSNYVQRNFNYQTQRIQSLAQPALPAITFQKGEDRSLEEGLGVRTIASERVEEEFSIGNHPIVGMSRKEWHNYLGRWQKMDEFERETETKRVSELNPNGRILLFGADAKEQEDAIDDFDLTWNGFKVCFANFLRTGENPPGNKVIAKYQTDPAVKKLIKRVRALSTAFSGDKIMKDVKDLEEVRKWFEHKLKGCSSFSNFLVVFDGLLVQQ